MKLHSVVDIITNSSSVIFTTLNKHAIENTKRGIANILEAAGDTRSVDQLFRFEIELEPGRMDDLREDYALDYADENGNFDESEFQKWADDYIQARVDDGEEGDYKYVAVYSRDTGAVVEVWPLLQAYDYDATWS